MEEFKEINLFDKDNYQLRKCFFFFFVVAICGYLSLMVSFCPYSDDYCRHVANFHVGTMSGQRHATFILELIMYLSNVITDAAPFTYVISCVFLAYSAVLCLRMFKVNLNNKLEILCFVPIVINPFILEAMMYRFDNPFMTLALLLAALSAYFSSLYKKRWFILQSVPLLISFFIYQAASALYFIVLTYNFVMEIHSGTSISKTVLKMRYWFFTLLFVGFFYLPFTYLLTYCVSNDGGMFLIPKNAENITKIIENILRYFSSMYSDWSGSAVGNIFFCVLAILIINTLIQTWNNTKSIVSIITVALGIFALLLAPSGMYVFLRVVAFEGNILIMPRIIYSMGMLISLVLFKNCRLFKQIKISYIFYAGIVSVFCLWNIVFLNSATNVIHYYRILQRHVSYDIAKDLFSITNDNKNIKEVCITGAVKSQAMSNFVQLYPIIEKIVPEQWNIPDYCRIALMSSNFSEQMLQFIPITKEYSANNYLNKRLIKKHMWYDLFLLDEHLLLVALKGDIKNKKQPYSIAKIRE